MGEGGLSKVQASRNVKGTNVKKKKRKPPKQQKGLTLKSHTQQKSEGAKKEGDEGKDEKKGLQALLVPAETPSINRAMIHKPL